MRRTRRHTCRRPVNWMACQGYLSGEAPNSRVLVPASSANSHTKAAKQVRDFKTGFRRKHLLRLPVGEAGSCHKAAAEQILLGVAVTTAGAAAYLPHVR